MQKSLSFYIWRNPMFYVPDGTKLCGFYECEDCSNRFLDLKIGPRIVCPYCGEEPDMEIGENKMILFLDNDTEIQLS